MKTNTTATATVIANHNATVARMFGSKNWSCRIVDRDSGVYGLRGVGPTKAAAIAACKAEYQRVASNYAAGVAAAQHEAWSYAMNRESGY